MSLVPVDPSSEASVITLLERAATWLAEAVHRGDANDVALVKAQVATAAEATKQLGLSKEIQLDAQEMVRRAEYALGKAIRRGQAEGTVLARGQGGSGEGLRNGGTKPSNFKDLVKPSDLFVSATDWHQTYAVSDGVEPWEFDAALHEAKAEGNLSRANVVRKVKGDTNPAGLTRQQRADLIADLAEQGYSSRQMPKRVGVTEETVRLIAREFSIEIPADRIVGRSRRIDSTHIVESTVTGLENTVTALAFIDWTEVDPSQQDEWATSLTDSISELRRFLKQIKEMPHV